jgi:Tfp pilus assembly protein PilF
MKVSLFLIFLASLLFSACSSNETLKEPSLEEKKAEVYYNQGTNELVSKNYQQALTNLLKAKELSPSDSRIRNNLGMAYFFREQPKLAITELKEAISMDEKNTDAKMNLATIYLETKNLKDSKKMYDLVLQDLTYPALYRVHYNLALLNLKIGDRKGAFEELEKATKEKDDYCPANYKLGQLYTEEYRFQEAYQAYLNSTKGTCVNNPEPHYAVGLSLINLNKMPEAKIKFKEIVEKFPKSNFKILAEKKLSNLALGNQSENISTTETITPETNIESPKF